MFGWFVVCCERLAAGSLDELPEHLSTSQGRRGWLREAKRQLDEERAKEAKPIPRSRPARLKEAKRRLEEELWVESSANAAYEAYRVHGRASDGKRLGASPTPYTPPEVPVGKMNLTDPDSRMLKATRGYIQGYNAQAAVSENQIVIAAEVTVDSPDFGHLEHERHNTVRTRNARLAAIHSLFRYAALRHPEHSALIQRVLAIPPKRSDHAIITFLTEAEVDALIAAPDRSTWTGRRDHALLLLATQTGLRVSELTGLDCSDIHLGSGAHVSCIGKGRKQRITPLTTATIAVLRVWLTERAGRPEDPLFPTSRGGRLSRDAVEHRLAKHQTSATHNCPSLAEKRITPHVLRHTAAMRLLHAGIDTSVIALWLGHEQLDTTQIYLHADLTLKEQALARTTPPDSKPGRYQPPDTTLAYLESLCYADLNTPNTAPRARSARHVGITRASA